MIILKRTLTLLTESGDVDFDVTFELPVQDAEIENGDYVCRCVIDWPGARWEGRNAGVDSCHALRMAQVLVGIRLYMSEAHAAGKLKCMEPGIGYGFPVPSNMRDMLVGYDRDFF
jgi:hypothetical protein